MAAMKDVADIPFPAYSEIVEAVAAELDETGGLAPERFTQIVAAAASSSV